MREESEIFEEWVTKELKIEYLDPLEYIAMRDSIGFQKYLLKERFNEFLESALPVHPLFKPILDFLKRIFRQ